MYQPISSRSACCTEYARSPLCLLATFPFLDLNHHKYPSPYAHCEDGPKTDMRLLNPSFLPQVGWELTLNVLVSLQACLRSLQACLSGDMSS